MAFFGEYTITITDGGRIVLPKKIRENLKGEEFILTKGYDVCLAGYERDDWDKRARQLMDVSLLDKENIDRRRFIFSGANTIEIDAQGRFVIPKALLGFIGITSGTVKIVGVGDHFEVWGETAWEEYLKKISI